MNAKALESESSAFGDDVRKTHVALSKMSVLASVLTELRIVNLLAETPSGRDKEDCLTNLELTSFYFFLYSPGT